MVDLDEIETGMYVVFWSGSSDVDDKVVGEVVKTPPYIDEELESELMLDEDGVKVVSEGRTFEYTQYLGSDEIVEIDVLEDYEPD